MIRAYAVRKPKGGFERIEYDMKQSKNRAFCFVPDRSPNAAGARTRRSGRVEKDHGRTFSTNCWSGG